ncbi:Pentatricopeptide repeat-containing protein [Glycine soja]
MRLIKGNGGSILKGRGLVEPYIILKVLFTLDVIHYNIMLCTLGRARKWDLVESLWTEMNAKGVAPVNCTYGTLIDAYSKRGLKEEALAWLQTMQSQGMEPDEVTMGIRAGEFQKAQEFFRRWIRGAPFRLGVDDKLVSHTNVCLRSHTYATFIDTYGKGGQFRAACETFARIIRQGRSLNTVTLNTMIHLYGNCGRLRQACLLFQKMGEFRCVPDTWTYNILIYLNIKNNKDERGLLEADVVSYQTLLYAYSTRKMEMDERDLEIDEFTQFALTRMYVESGMLEQSWLWFRRFHLAGNISSDCYSANISSGAKKVFIFCKELKKLTVLEFNVMIKAYGIGKCYDKAYQLFDSMKKFGVVADKCSYSSLIHILASADKPHIAKSYLKKMQEAGLG